MDFIVNPLLAYAATSRKCAMMCLTLPMIAYLLCLGLEERELLCHE